MKEYIYFSFTEADRKEAVRIAEQMKADGYVVWYDDGTDLDDKEDVLRNKENEATFALIYLTKRFLSDVDKMDGLYNLSDLEKSICFIGKEDFKRNRRFEDEFGDVRKMFLSKYDNLSELLQVLYQNELVGSCRKKNDEFEQCIYYKDLEGKAFVQYRSLTVIPDEIFNRKCKMVEALEAEKDKLAKECKKLKLKLEECLQEKKVIEKALNEKDASYERLDKEAAGLKKALREEASLSKALREEVKECRETLQKSQELINRLNAENEQLLVELQQRKEANDSRAAIFASFGRNTTKVPIKVEKKEPVLKGNIAVGNIVQFGSYPFGKQGEIKPIEWEVLEVVNGKALLLSKNCLDVQTYHTSRQIITWADCDLRGWLNNVFINKAFTKTEQAVIRKETIENPDNPKYNTNGGENSEDRIFCLSISEAERYLIGNKKIQKGASAFAMTKQPYVDRNRENAVRWWLRSPGNFSFSAASVSPASEVDANGSYVDRRNICVCPALYVDIAKLSS